MQDNQLLDPFGRRISYLRLSVTDRCDFRCTYCMSEDMVFAPRAQILSLEELYTVADAFIGLGVTRIRVTGGEPLVRKGLTSLLARLGAREELEDLSITSNGSQLGHMAADLRGAGVTRLNISLDSLQRERFAAFTRRDRLDQVLAGIDAARAAGFSRIKLNTVVQKGRNDDEVEDLVGFAVARGLDISFIEEMPLGSVSSHERKVTLCTSDEVRERVAQRFQLLPSSYRSGGPSRYYQVVGSGTQVGFISPHSRNFCGDCNRVRVTAEGKLVLCLGHEGALDLKALLRRHPGDSQRLRAALIEALRLKPERHHFEADQQVQVVRFMSMTGG
ncbi:GTP 3',8-cyclase MoaA [Metapseudomonas resinovorans]|uniref:GTP 3',8-cyclase n=1 Tax=Metapseudomonas resinovorans NBRC 106553 TaxID=1245471 RepID=S6ADV3_METRE|nr:GTP 3',8-cyclase MoaA [Pseudomonas resinovorans]BAN47647.1 molybdenum cofactor biosynthesis protein MoaA [Pseudomonas resinovorans NBRC 106553]